MEKGYINVMEYILTIIVYAQLAMTSRYFGAYVKN